LKALTSKVRVWSAGMSLADTFVSFDQGQGRRIKQREIPYFCNV